MSLNTRDSELAVYKIIIVGQSGVGKSNIVNRYVNDKFETAINTTIGVQFVSKTFQYQQTQVNLQIWDTAGQQRFRSVNKFFYKNAMGVLVIFSIACQQSFSKLPRWLKQIRQQIEQDAILVLVGNKSDLSQRQVSVGQATKFAKQQNMAYIQTSAALNINISKAFQLLTQALLLNFFSKKPQSKKQSIYLSKQINLSKQKKKKKKKCCD